MSGSPQIAPELAFQDDRVQRKTLRHKPARTAALGVQDRTTTCVEQRGMPLDAAIGPAENPIFDQHRVTRVRGASSSPQLSFSHACCGVQLSRHCSGKLCIHVESFLADAVLILRVQNCNTVGCNHQRIDMRTATIHMELPQRHAPCVRRAARLSIRCSAATKPLVKVGAPDLVVLAWLCFLTACCRSSAGLWGDKCSGCITCGVLWGRHDR